MSSGFIGCLPRPGTLGRLTEEAAVDAQDRRAVVAIAPTAVGDNLDR